MSDQIGMQDIGVNPGELDDDEGGGLVSRNTLLSATIIQIDTCVDWVFCV